MQLALADCVGLLKENERDLLQRRYAQGGSAKSVAAEIGLGADAVYKSLQKIHAALYRCISGACRGMRSKGSGCSSSRAHGA